MKNMCEKEAFSHRLAKALREARVEAGSPTVFAREFNRRYRGTPVSTHAVRKWLKGESIPTQDKVRLLATWLGVSAEWLRFGEGKHAIRQAAPPEEAGRASPDAELMGNIRLLSGDHQQVVREIVLALLRLEQGR
jgi:transcriptional regulator with XRE-family HTH domain